MTKHSPQSTKPNTGPNAIKKAETGKKAPSQKKGEERRLLIINTVLKMISIGGVDSVTHRRVAAAAEIPLGSTTYYFESREHLLREAFDHYIRQARQSLDGVAEEPNTSVTALVNNLALWAGREFENEDLLLTEYEMVLYAARDDQVAASLRDWDNKMVKDLAVLLKSLGAKHPTDLSALIIHVMRGYEVVGLSQKPPNLRVLKRRLRLLIEGLLNQ